MYNVLKWSDTLLKSCSSCWTVGINGLTVFLKKLFFAKKKRRKEPEFLGRFLLPLVMEEKAKKSVKI